jgi:ankyrin repeat protein
MNHLNKLKKYVVFVGFILSLHASIAGSYIDFFRDIERDNSGGIQRSLNEGFDPNTVSEKAQPALLSALRAESYKSAKVLIAHPNIQLDLTNPQGETPLMMAALKGNIDLMNLLIARGALVNKPGWSPLHYAATGPNAAAVALLIRNRADVNAASPNGTTPLMMAARYGSSESLNLLIQAGADLQASNAMGLNALDFARQGARPDATEILHKLMDQPQWPDLPTTTKND